MEEDVLNLFEKLFKTCGEDPYREGLKNTPHRFLKAFLELTQGYQQNLDEIINNALFEAPNHEPIILNHIPFYSLCEHHLLPFFGYCTVKYIPNRKILGLSKIYRIIEFYSKRLQLQERLTHQIGEAIQKITDAKGIYVEMVGEHMCVAMRGVQKTQSSVKTIYRFGEEIYELANNSQNNTVCDCILKIATLDIPLHIGCYDEEKGRTTPVQITIELKLNELRSLKTDQLKDTICYDQLINYLKTQCFNKTYQLIEHACSSIFEEIKEFLKQKGKEAKVRVTLTKQLKHTLLNDSQFILSEF